MKRLLFPNAPPPDIAAAWRSWSASRSTAHAEAEDAVGRGSSCVSKSLKSIGVISFLTGLSRVLALVRDSLSLAIFGASALMSAFTTAFICEPLPRLLAEGR